MAPRAARNPRALGWARIILACTAFLGAAGRANAQHVREDFWFPNDAVRALCLAGNTLYVGGDFTRVGPTTGSGVPVDAVSGATLAGFPAVDGAISAVVADGSGGWFVAGPFATVGGAPRSNLAHILADHSVAPWAPEVEGGIESLALSGNRLYLAGPFFEVNGERRLHLAAVDARTGALEAWAPETDGAVSTVVPSGGTVYVGGFFTSVSGQPRNGIAAIDAATGVPTAWDPGALPGLSEVTGIAAGGNTIYVCGDFHLIGGQPRRGLAALDATTGVATGWNPAVDADYIAFHCLLLSGDNLYVGGNFSHVGGRSRGSVAALDTTTGLATNFDPGVDDFVGSLVASDTTLYLAGDFSRVGGQARTGVAAVSLVTGAVTPWDPGVSPVHSVVHGVATDGRVVYLGGEFASVGGRRREHLAAFDVHTGRPTDWDPGADAPGARARRAREHGLRGRCVRPHRRRHATMSGGGGRDEWPRHALGSAPEPGGAGARTGCGARLRRRRLQRDREARAQLHRRDRFRDRAADGVGAGCRLPGARARGRRRPRVRGRRLRPHRRKAAALPRRGGQRDGTRHRLGSEPEQPVTSLALDGGRLFATASGGRDTPTSWRSPAAMG